jgi:hypothetical protein
LLVLVAVAGMVQQRDPQRPAAGTARPMPFIFPLKITSLFQPVGQGPGQNHDMMVSFTIQTG